MKQLAFTAVAALGLVAVVGEAVPAQTPLTPFVSQPLMPYVPPATSPFYRPAVSPYLGLALPGNTALNYFNIVRPQIQTYNALQQLQGEVAVPGTLGAYGDYGAGVLITGHVSAFQNHWGFFQNWRGAGFNATGIYGGALAGPRLGLGTVGTGFLRPGAGIAGQQPRILAAPSVQGLQTAPPTQPMPTTQPTPGTQPTPKPGSGTQPQ